MSCLRRYCHCIRSYSLMRQKRLPRMCVCVYFTGLKPSTRLSARIWCHWKWGVQMDSAYTFINILKRKLNGKQRKMRLCPTIPYSFFDDIYRNSVIKRHNHNINNMVQLFGPMRGNFSRRMWPGSKVMWLNVLYLTSRNRKIIWNQ